MNVTITKQLRTNQFDAGYSHRPGDSTGLGGTSESHQGRLGFSKSLGRTASINFQALAFRQNQQGTEAYNYWSANGSAALSKQLGKHLVTSIGASYMTYMGRTQNDYAYRRLYISFGYRFPDFLKTEK